MGRRLGKKRRKVTLPEGPYVVHDRQAKDLLRNAQVAPLEVEDPYEPGSKILVMRSTRRDPLAWLHAHQQITDAQYHGGRDWQRDWERVEQGARAIDPTKEAVDGGRFHEPFTESRKRASDRLNGVAWLIEGQDDKRILSALLVEGMGLEQIGLVYFGRFGAGYLRRLSERVRKILDVLAEFYGYQTATVA